MKSQYTTTAFKSLKMRLLAFALAIAFVGASTLNRTPGIEHEHVVKEADWVWIPDADYKPHLIDINAEDDDIEPRFDGFKDIIFRLFTRSNPLAPQTIPILNDTELKNSFFNPAYQTRFHIHGWLQSGPDTAKVFRDAYLAEGNFNVFAVDWGAGAMSDYIRSRYRVGEVGNVVAQFIDWLNLHGMAFADVTVLGHSLGAHAAGYTGKAVKRGRLPVIVAIDPAAPLFSVGNPATRVDFTDATHVEVISTSSTFLGFKEPLGHANFYPNWGKDQPGCKDDPTGVCSHIIAASFMAESINPARVFGARRCRDYNDIKNENCVTSGPSRRMGGEPVFDGDSPPHSVYFLETNPKSPYSQGPIDSI